jgi:ABC-type amino acid transport system permease subunit
VSAETFASFAIWGLVAVLYFILIFSVSKFASYLERRLQVDRR